MGKQLEHRIYTQFKSKNSNIEIYIVKINTYNAQKEVGESHFVALAASLHFFEQAMHHQYILFCEVEALYIP